jgi:hypothetical protein
MTQIHEHDLGLSWVADDTMARAAHALRDGERVWLVDPFEDAQALERAAALGTPAGVLQLLDRHGRDCAALAARLGVPHLVVPETLPADLPFLARRVIRNRLWKEVALWWPDREALVVAEVLGTADAWTLGAGPVGVHPMRRLLAVEDDVELGGRAVPPPGGLRDLAPAHLLVGHGPPRHGPDTASEMRAAIDHSRRDTPRLLLKLPALLRTGAQSRL